MTTNLRKKNSRQRGSFTHGWGSKKKHRGAGNRGGRGNAGTGKRGDAKKPSIWKTRYFGKYGFKRKALKEVRVTINLKTLQENLDLLLTEGFITKQGDKFVIALENIGANKLLGSGVVSRKMEIVTPHASAKAIEKIEAFGGEVKVISKEDTSEAEVEATEE